MTAFRLPPNLFRSQGPAGKRTGLWQAAALVLAAVITIDPAAAQSKFKTLAGTVPIPREKPGEAGTDRLKGAFQTLDQNGDETDDDQRTRAFAALTAGEGAQAPVGDGVVLLAARLSETGQALDSGVVWRVFNETGNATQPLQLVQTSTGGQAEFRLPAGEYVVHAAYGHSGQSRRMFIGGDIKTETIILNAGGLRLSAAIAEDLPLATDVVTFDIARRDEDSGGVRETVASNAKQGAIYRLNAGTYQVTSRYGDVNAVVRAEITVQPGQLTDATIYHRAAEITLKLVNDSGGEALANTAWSILTPGGDVVFEEVGAFPSVILGEGVYTIVAKHEIGMFSRQFSVIAGHSRDVEVLTTAGRR